MNYGFISQLYPRKIRKSYITLLSYFDLSIQTELILGFILFSGIGLSLIFSFQVALFYNAPIYVIFIALFIMIEFLIHALLTLAAERKAKFVESVLPDVLQLMASNLRSGLTPDKAFLVSTRPEFGILNHEINRIGKEITTGKDMEHALKSFSKRFKSEVLSKTIDLILLGLNSGGEFSSLLDQVSDNLKQQKLIKEKVRSSVMMYTIFIFCAISFGAPVLFGFSSFLIQILVKNLSEIELFGGQMGEVSLPLKMSQIAISPDFVIFFIIVSLFTTSFMGSFVLGAISKGKPIDGLKFIPILSFFSLGLFFLVRFIILNAFGDLLGV